ncbi:hypothetical protein [Nocardia arthritidis]|uniref:Lipoprotein n=1 Tax=Nocardia arthritidis TaxID=228602 RepID=A0A6G9YN36_9NOCA|nr:hypothetical protein [Nocardia arthritidis]QIS14624.1 hypothetical protein F5544_33945 [Nocardia arthritidis]
MRRALALLLPAAFLLIGCKAEFGEKSAPDELAKCANIHFAAAPHVAAQHFAADFGAGRTVSAIVDVPQDQVAPFQQLSALGRFTPGVPPEWRSEHWMDSAVADALKADTGNIQFNDYHPPFPARWIVIHDSGNDQRRIFIKAYCEGDA